MSERNQYSLIKKLYTTMPRGMPLDLSVLNGIGISSQRAASYAKNGWLTRVAHGVYIFPDQELDFCSAISYLSRHVRGLHIGGYSALMSDSLDAEVDELVLWGNVRGSLPRWFSERFCVRYVSARLFDWGTSSYASGTLVDAKGTPHCVKTSIPERALLEMLYEAGGKHTLESAKSAFSSVDRLCPDAVGHLLKCCTSVKAIRLFLKWARQSGRLDVDEILQRYDIRAGSNSRWMTRLKDGTLLCLKPYG